MGGDLLALLDDLVSCPHDGGAADGQRARAVGAHAHGHEGGVAVHDLDAVERHAELRSEEHTSELQSLMRISYAVFCLKKKKYKDTRKRSQVNRRHRKRNQHTKTPI